MYKTNNVVIFKGEIFYIILYIKHTYIDRENGYRNKRLNI